MSVPSKDGVVAVLQDTAGRYLFIQRGLTLRRAPGYWCFVGGEVEAGETFEAAIEREVREEVGLDVRADGKVHESLSPNNEYRLHWMRVRLRHEGQTLRPHAVEVAQACWLSTVDALRCEPMLPTLQAWLKAQLTGAATASDNRTDS